MSNRVSSAFLAVAVLGAGAMAYLASCGVQPELATYRGQAGLSQLTKEVQLNGDCATLKRALASLRHRSGYDGYDAYGSYGSYDGYDAYGSYGSYSGYPSYSGYDGYDGYGAYNGYPSYSGYDGYGAYNGYPSYDGYGAYNGYPSYDGYGAYNGYPGYDGYPSFGNLQAAEAAFLHVTEVQGCGLRKEVRAVFARFH